MIILIVILFLNATTPIVHAENSVKTYFAQIMFEQVYFYKAPINDDSTANVYFEIPKTYFVELLNNANENFYYAKYSTLTGYVKKESVQAVANTPNKPFLDNLNFRIYADLSRELRSEPNVSSSSSLLIASIPLYSRNLVFYGKITGENLIEGRTETWYYCKYLADVEYFGYVYSDFCDELPTTLPVNTEEVTYIANPTFIEEPPINTTNSINYNSNTTAIVVGIITIPALIFVFMILKNKSVLGREKSSSKEIKEYY